MKIEVLIGKKIRMHKLLAIKILKIIKLFKLAKFPYKWNEQKK